MGPSGRRCRSSCGAAPRPCARRCRRRSRRPRASRRSAAGWWRSCPARSPGRGRSGCRRGRSSAPARSPAAPVRKRQVAAKASGPNAVSRWSMPAMTTFSAPFNAGPLASIPVGVPRRPIHTPSGWENLSFASERIVSQRTPGSTSSPDAPRGTFRATRNGPAPLNSLFGRNVGSIQTPWFGTPPSTACETSAAPPPLAMKLRIALPPRELPISTTFEAPVRASTDFTSAARCAMCSAVEVRPAAPSCRRRARAGRAG